MNLVNGVPVNDPLLKWFTAMLAEKKLVPEAFTASVTDDESSVFAGCLNHLFKQEIFSVEEYNRELEQARKNQLVPYQELTALGISAVVHLLEKKGITGARDDYYRQLESENGEPGTA